MNRVTIINGLEGEGKTTEVMDDLINNVGVVGCCTMKHFFLTSGDYETTTSIIEDKLTAKRKDDKDFAIKTPMGVYIVKTFKDLERIAKDVDDDSTVLYVDGTENITDFNMESFLELVDKYQFDCYITRQRCKDKRGVRSPKFKNCLISVNDEDLLPKNGREVISTKTDSVHYNLFTGEICKVTDLESSVTMDRTMTTVKVAGKYEIEIIDVKAVIYRDGRVIGNSSFTYMPAEEREQRYVMEQFCGEQGECSTLNYWLVEDNIADIASMLSMAGK